MSAVAAFCGFRDGFKPVGEVFFFVTLEAPGFAADLVRGATWGGWSGKGIENHETPFKRGFPASSCDGVVKGDFCQE